MLGYKTDEVSEERKKLHMKQLHDLYSFSVKPSTTPLKIPVT
jgi:hypothetical protein